jgi:hypothetical protein
LIKYETYFIVPKQATFVPEYVESSRSHKGRTMAEFPRVLSTSRESSSKMQGRQGVTKHYSFRKVYVEDNLEAGV